MSYYYNANSVPPRDAQDSDSELAYATADSRRHSETNTIYDTNAAPSQSSNSSSQWYPEYGSEASSSVPVPPQPNSRMDRHRSSGQIPVLVMDETNVFRPVLSRESTTTAGFSGGSEVTDCPEVNNLPSPRLRAALHQLTTKPIDKIHHYSQLGEYVKQLYQEKGMADVMISINDETFPTHRIALASQSEYFSNLFLNEVSNNRLKLPLEIRIKGIEPDAFRAFLTYIYTGELNVRPDLVSDFLFMSSKLKCHGILETWQDLLENMTPEQALILVDKVATSGPLYKQAYEILRRNFIQLHKWKRFYYLNADTMCKLLTDDELAVRSEAEVFEEVMNWLQNAKDQSPETEVRLLRRIRYSLMSSRELFHCCKQSPVFKTDPVCKELVLRGNWLHTTKQMGVQDGMTIEGSRPRNNVSNNMFEDSPTFDQPTLHSPPSQTLAQDSSVPRPPPGLENVPDVPEALRSASQIDDYSIDDEIIGDHLTPHRNPRAKVTSGYRHGGSDKDAFLTGDIIAVGGSQKRNRDHKHGRHVQRYSSEKNKWMQFAPLPEHRQNHAVAIFGGKLYLTGGCESDKSRRAATQACNRVFVFDTDENIWNEVAPMMSKRRCHALCPLFGKLYALGGQDEWGRVLNTAERYNPHENNWSYISPMRYARLGAGAAVFKGFLFVVGGYGEEGGLSRGLPILKVVECFDPRIHKWTVKHDLRIPRCYCNLVCSQNRLYVFGGASEVNNMLQSISSVDLYDARSDAWEHVANLKTARHNSGSAVIGKKIFIIGGVCSKDHNQVLQSIECYNAGTGFWESGVEPLPHPAKSVGCAVLPVLSK